MTGFYALLGLLVGVALDVLYTQIVSHYLAREVAAALGRMFAP